MNVVKELHPLINDNLGQIRALCAEYQIESLFAFGSICTGSFDETSDVDLLVSFKSMDHGDYAENYFEAADSFEKLFHRSVDLVTDKSLSNPYFIDSVNESKVLLYGK